MATSKIKNAFFQDNVAINFLFVFLITSDQKIYYFKVGLIKKIHKKIKLFHLSIKIHDQSSTPTEKAAQLIVLSIVLGKFKAFV